MRKQTIVTFFVALVIGIFSISASAQTHSVWTNDNGIVIRDAKSGCEYQRLRAFDMATSWTEPTPGYSAMAHFRGVSKAYAYSILCNTDHFYEFTLVRASSTTNDEIFGRWNVYRDGTLMCSGCAGTAYGLSGAVGSYYKVYIDDPVYGPATWLYAGYIDARKDF